LLKASRMTEQESGTKTIAGVGVAALLASATPPRALRSIEVAGTIDCERSTAGDAKPLASMTLTQDIPEALAASAAKRLPLGLLAGALALSISIAVGLYVRSTIKTGPAPSKPPMPAAAIVPALSNVPPPVEVEQPTPSIDTTASPAHVDIGDGSCSVTVESSSPARIWVDDQAVGRTPVEVSGLWCGRQIQVRLQRTGFESWTRAITPQEGRRSLVMASLRRVPRPPRPAPTPFPPIIEAPPPRPQ
jgi:hypothetical protein